MLWFVATPCKCRVKVEFVRQSRMFGQLNIIAFSEIYKRFSSKQEYKSIKYTPIFSRNGISTETETVYSTWKRKNFFCTKRLSQKYLPWFYLIKY